MKVFHYTCQGESHIEANKVCQDASDSITRDSMSMAIVCDGHGGSRYFRSDIGAKIATNVTKVCVEEFIRQIDTALLKGKPYTKKSAISSEVQLNLFTKDTLTDKSFRQLFSSIIYNWRVKIVQHAEQFPLTSKEKEQVEYRYQNDFINGIGIEKVYGCTLICYVITADYWFAFQIGDGKCISFDMEGNWEEPIPWDENCFLNKTTSLCDSSALNEFRYSYCGDGHYPLAVFLGTDGIDDSFGEIENMIDFYIQVLKLIVNEGEEHTLNTVKETLPQLSKIGSKDDLSMACIYDDILLSTYIKSLIIWQYFNVSNAVGKLNVRISQLQLQLRRLSIERFINNRYDIDYQYILKELARASDKQKKLMKKWAIFYGELTD